MFRCQKCGKTTKANEKENRITIKKREKTYYYYIVKTTGMFGKTKITITPSKDFAEKEHNSIVKEFDSKGWEVVCEENWCKNCYEKTK